MHNQNVILSICIPTYNRSEYLNSSLLSVFKQIKNNSLVEVIVSDNHSTDDTEEIVKSFQHYDNFKYYRQNINVGMSRNILDVVSNANGEFCWLIGDDDFILQGAIDELLKLFQINKDVDFYYVKPQGFQLDEYKSCKGVFDTKYHKTVSSPIQYQVVEKWEELIGPKYSLIFMGELMTSVFRREIWSTFKINPDQGFLSNIENSYVFTVVYANTFFGKKSMYVSTPMILALDGVRDWWDRLGFILIVLVKDLLDLYKEKGLKKTILNECYVSYISMTLPYAYKYVIYNSDYKDKISIKKYLFFLLTHPNPTFKALVMLNKILISKTLRRIFPSFHKNLSKIIKNT